MFDVPPGRLEDVLISIGLRAEVTIVLAEPSLASQSSPGARGRLSLHSALSRALQNTGGEVRSFGPDIIQIIRRQPVRKARSARMSPTQTGERATAIIVTASKQLISIDRYPGSVKFVDLDQASFAQESADMASVATRVPALGSTNLGPGRNKFFIRGIADSSFTGPTQATTGQYLGDIRLNYNAPDPDLNLYDVERVEILVGPQGALYGAGSLGGIIRLMPRAPDPAKFSVTASASVGNTHKGGTSVEGATMLNIPLVQDNIAARIVLYDGRAAGYIDAPTQGRHDINSRLRAGVRLALRARNASGWDITLGLVQQKLENKDGQYIRLGDPDLIRDAPIPQPFTNNYWLGYVTAGRRIGEWDVASATSIARHHLHALVDATGLDGTTAPFQARERNDISLFAHETRISGRNPQKPWVGGIALLDSSSKFALSLASFSGTSLLAEVGNRQIEAATFGKYSHPITATLTATIGGRLTLARNRQTLSLNRTTIIDHRSRTDIRWSGTAALAWRSGRPLSFFFQYQQGYRPAGLGITTAETQLRSHKFAADDLDLFEIGLRLGVAEGGRLAARAAIFSASWHNIQADLVDEPGLPYTTNIGRGIIRGLDFDLTWRPTRSLTATLSAFLNHSELSRPAPGYIITSQQDNAALTRTLPNVAKNGARVGVAWIRQLPEQALLRTNASLRYVGRSHLGFGPLMDVPQGGYLVADATTSVDFGLLALSAGVTNIADVRGNTFAYGNPYSLALRNQSTPLRPRTITLGISARF